MNWQNCVEHSLKYKKAPPSSYFYRLEAHEVGLKGQDLLLLSCNNGKLAIEFAKRGVNVTVIDSNKDFLEEAEQQAEKQNLKITFVHGEAENIPLDGHRFDVVLVHQSLRYLNIPRVLTEVRRLLEPGGLFVVSHLRWLPRLDIIAKKSDEIILQHNPRWEHFDFNGEVAPMPNWAIPLLLLRGMFFYDENLLFTQDEWIGRLKASGCLSGTLSRSKLLDFENDLIQTLIEIKDGDLEIRHRIDAYIFQYK